jgi:hypothetical protein
MNPQRDSLVAGLSHQVQGLPKKDWIDEYSGNEYRIRTWGHHGDRNTARVKTYGEVLEEYEFHPESKCADADGNPCDKLTIGFLQRRYVRIDQLKCIGKESNSLENVESGLEHSEKNEYTELYGVCRSKTRRMADEDIGGAQESPAKGTCKSVSRLPLPEGNH